MAVYKKEESLPSGRSWPEEAAIPSKSAGSVGEDFESEKKAGTIFPPRGPSRPLLLAENNYALELKSSIGVFLIFR